ncbi:unnamed protein product [Fraxinus pennsylvanica]|uniref:Uncharacterized protein n=1 Tax=Fraxinus pennsylvanica TaxID=56036 RepID=A0AAD1ZY83_9LAMI|nr:unnamed protein product [Fraxinus pennsylvanica]
METEETRDLTLSSAKTIMEARKAELDLAICITEGISQHDMVFIKAAINNHSKTQLIGPNCPGIIKHRESIFQTTAVSLGQSTCVEIGGGNFNGTEFVYCIEKFFADLQTESGTKKPIGDSIESCKDHIWQVIRTSSISSYYLVDYTGGVYRWQDRAIVANIPTNFTVREAQLLWPETKIDCLVSIGCGSIPTKVHRDGWLYLDTGQV